MQDGPRVHHDAKLLGSHKHMVSLPCAAQTISGQSSKPPSSFCSSAFAVSAGGWQVICTCIQHRIVTACFLSLKTWFVSAALQERGHLARVAQTSWRNITIFSSDLQQVGATPLLFSSDLSALLDVAASLNICTKHEIPLVNVQQHSQQHSLIRQVHLSCSRMLILPKGVSSSKE